MKKILITGITGFIGKNLLETWKNDCSSELIGISSKKVKGLASIKYYNCDLIDKTEVLKAIVDLEKPDVLVLLAWDVTPGVYWESPRNKLWADACIRLSKIFLEAGGKLVLFAGTSASYKKNQMVYCEDFSVQDPFSLYGKEKLRASKTIQELSERYSARYIEARIFSIYGKYERENRLVTNVIKDIMEGRIVENSKWNLYRDYIYSEDAARAIKFLIENDDANGTYNISSGNPTSIRYIVSYISKVLQAEGRVRFLEPDTEDDELFMVGINEKIRSLGFRCQYDIEQGLKQSIAYIRGEK